MGEARQRILDELKRAADEQRVKAATDLERYEAHMSLFGALATIGRGEPGALEALEALNREAGGGGVAMAAAMGLLATYEATAGRVNRPVPSADAIAEARVGAARVVEDANRAYAGLLREQLAAGCIPPFSGLLENLDTYTDLTAQAATLTGRDIRLPVSPSVRPAMQAVRGDLQGLVAMLEPTESESGTDRR